MKIRTEYEFQDVVDKEVSWRKKELSALKSNIYSTRKFAKNTALRAGIALLYAHWEGMIKNIATYYLCYVNYQNCKYSELKPNFLALSIKDELCIFNKTNKASVHNKILQLIKSKGAAKAIIPYENIIKTNSNLNSVIFVEIMETIGLDYKMYESSFVLIDEVLLKMRNEIAHGERIETLSLDEDRFNEIYNSITSLMNSFVNQVCNAVSLKAYKIK